MKVFLLSLVFCVSALANGRVETVRFQSKLINTTLPYNIILPNDYNTSKTTRYPVLYLLHGLTGHVQQRYRTIEARYGRAIAGLSMGGYGAIKFGLKHCGTEDSPLIFPSNRELAALMFEKKIPHEFRELPGDHSWSYWDQQVREVLQIAAEKMRLPRTKRTSRA